MKKETYRTAEEMAKYYVRDTEAPWIRIPDSQWFYKEFRDHVVFGVIGPYLRTKQKRLPPLRTITVSRDGLIVGILNPEHHYLLASLGEYVDELQENRRSKGIFDVANTPHIFE